MVGNCASLRVVRRNCACNNWSFTAWKRLRRNPGEEARGEFEDFARGSRQGFDQLWLDRQKQRRRSHPDRACHGTDNCRTGEAKAGARRSDRYAGGASNGCRCKSCSSLSSPRQPPKKAKRSVACGIAARASSGLAFASGSVIAAGPRFTQPHEKSMTVLNISMLQRSCNQ